MSRLIVKGLPATMTEPKLRAMFSERGTVTDCQLKYTREGKFRRFAFVGFDNERDAEDARHHLDRTFINASRIEVEVCKPFGDETKPRAWSKYAKDSSAYQQLNPSGTEEKTSKYQAAAKKSKIDPNKDPKFAEFLEVQNKTGLFTPKEDEDQQVEATDDLIVQLLRGVSGDTKLSLTFRGLPPSVKQKSVKEWLAPIRLKAMKIVRNEVEAAAFISFNRMPDVRRALQRTGEFLGGFKVEIAKVPTSGGSGAAAAEEEEPEAPEDRKTENEKITAAILDTGRLFVRNLPYVCTTETLESLFSTYGEIADLTLVVDKKTGKSKGFAVVTFVFPENAAAAYAALDGTIFQGRMLHLLPGEEKRDAPNGGSAFPDADAKSSFKKTKDAKVKANAGQSHTWNALFLGANAVADTLAAKLNTTKAALLDADGGTSAGVRMALGETRLVRETRDFLLAN
uniref:RRM domain-containing protein n=1 Tax=Plectus sambesii TaxID=2011161 RepID=A0A914W1V9_9BILA